MTDFTWAVVLGIVAFGGVAACQEADCPLGISPWAEMAGDCAADASGPTEGDGGQLDAGQVIDGGQRDAGKFGTLAGLVGYGRDGGKPGQLDAGQVIDGGQLDAGQVIDGGQLDAAGPLDAGPLVCESGFYDCDGDRANGCEWDGCAMVVFLNLRACGMCGGVELCGCGPGITKRDTCDIDCNGMGDGVP
jgi:hypothetical protein